MDTMDIIITGANVAWLGKVDQGKGTTFKIYNLAADSGTSKMNFDAIADGGYKIPLPADQASDTKIEVGLINAAKIQWKKVEPIINGDTGTVESGAGDSGVSKGEISLTVVGKDMDSTTWSGFCNKVKDNIGKYWFVCLPTGYTSGTMNAATPNAEGFVFLIGKLSADFDAKIAGASPTTVALSFKSEAVAAYADDADTEPMTDSEADTWFTTTTNMLLPTITDEAMDIDVNPPAFGATDGHKIIKGEILFIPAA